MAFLTPHEGYTFQAMTPAVTAIAFGRNRGGAHAFRSNFRRIRLNPDVPGPALTEEQKDAHDHILKLLTKSLNEQGHLVTEADTPTNVIVVVLAGAAGTGKTTLMRTLMKSLAERKVPNFLMAPTGKAASRLKQVTGADTKTIHGAFFKGASTVGICPACKALSPSLGILPAVAVQKGIPSVRCERCGTQFRVPEELVGIERTLQFNEGEKMPEVAVAIVDESSMISKKLYADMMARVPTNWRILFVGDKEQLQPVVKRGDPEGWGVGFEKPDVTLSKVLRQAAGNPIIQLATLIRMGENGTSYWAYGPDQVAPDPRLRTFRVRSWNPPVEDYVRHRLAQRPDGSWDTDKQDVVMLTFINATRRHLNSMIREQLVIPSIGKSFAELSRERGMAFVPGDRLLVTFNNHALSMMNGEVYSVQRTRYLDKAARDWGLLLLDLRMYDGSTKTVYVRNQAVGLSPDLCDIAFDENRQRYNDVSYAMASLLRDKDVKDPLRRFPSEVLWAEARCVHPWLLLQCDYGDCISIVKSQGSQWKNVIVVWDDTTQWLMEKKASEGDEYGRRLAYTALTRASDTAHIYMVGERKPFDRLEKFESDVRDNRIQLPAWMSAKPYAVDRNGDAVGDDDALAAARRLLRGG